MTFSQTTSMPPRPSRPATSVGKVLALVAGFVVLAVIGATIGWTLTDTSGSTPLASSSLSPSASTTASPTPTKASASASASKTAQPGQTVPDFAADGVSFIVARQTLMGMKIQAALFFDASRSDGPAVTRSDPAANSPIHKGDTVKLFVGEAAPVLAVPNEISKPCRAAGSDVARVGFLTSYATSQRSGVVTAQDPASTATNAHWTDHITLTCGSAPPPPSDPASAPATPSTGPS